MKTTIFIALLFCVTNLFAQTITTQEYNGTEYVIEEYICTYAITNKKLI